MKFILILILLLSSFICLSQPLYTKNFTAELIATAIDSLNKIESDSSNSIAEKNCVIICTNFFPNMRYKKIKLITQKQKNIIKTKSIFLNLFKKPINRVYKIYIGKNFGNTLDSVSVNYLNVNSKIGLIGREITRIDEYSTSGFFSLMAHGLKKLSRGQLKKFEYDVEMRMIEVGLGYQLKSLAAETEQKTSIEKWTDPEAYASFIKQNKGKHLSVETITNFINDFPVYGRKEFR